VSGHDDSRLSIRIGGLMRCCVGTWQEYDGPEDEGTVLPCLYCSSSMIVREGAWEWNHPRSGEPGWSE
jgi:hypothetical protein